MTDQTIIEISRLGFVTILNISGLWILAWYRINKKWKRAKNENLKQMLEAHWVEIVISFVIIPQWPETIRAAINLFVK